MKGESKESKEAFDRYELILDFLNSKSDEKALRLIDELINKAARYIDIVNNYERIMQLQKFRAQYEEKITEEFKRLDDIRKIAHNALISQLKIVNRYLFKNYGKAILPGGIYSLKPETLVLEDSKSRDFIAYWAGYIVEALYRRGIKS